MVCSSFQTGLSLFENKLKELKLVFCGILKCAKLVQKDDRTNKLLFDVMCPIWSQLWNNYPPWSTAGTKGENAVHQFGCIILIDYPNESMSFPSVQPLLQKRPMPHILKHYAKMNTTVANCFQHIHQPLMLQISIFLNQDDNASTKASSWSIHPSTIPRHDHGLGSFNCVTNLDYTYSNLHFLVV